MGKKFDYMDCFNSLCSEKKKGNESKIKYYIDEEEMTIVAVMTNCEYDAIKILDKNGLLEISNQNFNLDNFMINTVYRGKAKCSPEDEWDEEEGMRIARNRMLANYYRARTMALMRAESALKKILDDIGCAIDYSDFRCEKAYGASL